MAAVHQTQTSCHENIMKRTSPECSIIVDDVDEGRLTIEVSASLLHQDEPSPETASERIQEFQRVAEGRKVEFARLLEEHAQVIRRLKQMEEAESGCQPGEEKSSA